MNSLSELLPILLILSPLVGAAVTAMMVRFDASQIRPTATANVTCTLLLLFSACGQYEQERAAEANARLLSDQDGIGTASDIALRQSRHRKLDRIHADLLSHRWLAVDGLNLWPMIVCACVTAGLIWQGSSYKLLTPGFIPCLLFFEATVFGTLMANDVRVYLISVELSLIVMTVILARWAGADRRILASRFLLVQFSGHLFVAFGLAMVMVGLPWMKVDESTSTPIIIYKLSSMSFEIQTWVTNNQLAFQYVQEVFPFVILTLCLGFAIQIGLIPFQSSMTSIIAQCPIQISLIYITGFCSAACASWYRLVFPIAPDILARFDRLILIAALAGPVWSLIRCAHRPANLDRAAYVYFGLTSLSLLGTYCMSQISLGSGWLFQQQASLLVCLLLTMVGSPGLVRHESTDQSPVTTARSHSMQIVLTSIALIGFFASSSGLLAELLRESLELSAMIVGLLVAILALVASLINRLTSPDGKVAEPLSTGSGFSNRILAGLLLIMMLIVNLAPQLMLMQCEPEFARVFRQFEKIAPASSARLHSDLRQTSPQVP